MLACVLALLAGCSEAPGAEPARPTSEEEPRSAGPLVANLDMPPDIVVANPETNAGRSVYFGDLHVHSNYSLDAFSLGAMATPYDAYRYANGGKLRHAAGFDVQLREPLDFYAVTDHAMFIGAMREAADTSTAFSRYAPFHALHDLNAPENLTVDSIPARVDAMITLLSETVAGVTGGDIDIERMNGIARDAWSDTVRAAEQYNRPGKFTTFVGFEYTTNSDEQGNLHRNVIFRGADKLPAMPFSRGHSRNPEDLWDWMDGLREQGIEALAIPHNANGSNGAMFMSVDWAGRPMDETYARQRIRNEPLVEITQIKGTSETHPALSPNDEWADFEIMPYRISIDDTRSSEPKGSYARDALLSGLVLRASGVANPYKFGFIGSSDTHNGATSDDEANHFGKLGLRDSTPELRGSVALEGQALADARDAIARKEADPEGDHGPLRYTHSSGEIFRDGPQIAWGASGLAAVWAEENTRDAIYDAFRRKETFGTSGTRIKLRFFGGYGFHGSMLAEENVVTRAYAEGVSMGSDLPAGTGAAPSFVAWAVQDAHSAPLQRLQVVKGWIDDGDSHERVFDIACSAGEPDPATHRCPDNGAGVHLGDCSFSEDAGAAELKAAWTDPDFDPDRHAFYYLRVLENPTCRWSTWDALRTGAAPREGVAATIQERAWSSPIWYLPR